MPDPDDKSPTEQHPPAPQPPAASEKPGGAKKKLTLDVTDVSEVLERKISP